MVRKLGVLLFLAGAVTAAFLRFNSGPTTGWERIAPGVEMRSVEAGAAGLSESTQVIAIRTVPTRVHVAAGSMLDAAGWRLREAALAAVNGGFFDPVGRSVGLRIRARQTMTRAHRGNGGVFFVRRGAAQIVSTSEFIRRSHSLVGIDDAVQCAPLLVSNGRVSRLKPQSNRRTGIGIQPDGHVVIAISDGPVSLPDWAACWASSTALNCPNALNLDGGPSTQLSLKSAGKAIEITGGWPVPDAIVIK